MPRGLLMFSSKYDNGVVTLHSGATVSFHEEGRSDKTLIMLHGLNAHSGTWRKTVPHFSSRWRVLALTLPRTSLETFRVEQYSELVHEVMNELGVQFASVIGNSMGGWIAMNLAVTYSKRVRALVLESSAGIDRSRDGQCMGRMVNETGVPVLIVWGEDDKVISFDQGEMLNSQITNSTLVKIAGAGHASHWEKPEEFNTLVEKFLLTTTID